MGHALVWVESLASVLLLVATAAAWSAGRPRGSLSRWAVPSLALILIAVPAGVMTYGLGFLARIGTVSAASFVASAAWMAAFGVGAFAVIFAGLRAGSNPAGRPWSVGSLAVAFAALAALTGMTVANLDTAVKAQLAALRVEAGAKALALTPPRPSDDGNAAAIYLRAFAALTPPERLPALLKDRAGVWTSYDRSAFDPTDREQRDFLDSQQRGLALLREAAARPGCYFDRDWTNDTSPLDVPVPELPSLRQAATLLAYDALARASRGDSRGANDNVAAIFGMARHIHDPMLIDLLAATAVARTGARALEDVLALAPPKAEELARLNTDVGEPFRQRLRRTFTMEESWGLAAFVMIATGRAQGSPDIQSQTPMDALGAATLDTPLYRVFFLEDDLAAFRRHLRTARDIAARPAVASLEGWREFDRSLRSNRGGGILAGLLVPATMKCAFAAMDGDALRGLVRLGVAASAYKAKHGRHPDKLADLVPEFIAEIPPDPYDGRPLRLHRTEDGLVLYSIGRDERDDGGRPQDAVKLEGDLVFRLR